MGTRLLDAMSSNTHVDTKCESAIEVTEGNCFKIGLQKFLNEPNTQDKLNKKLGNKR